MCSHRFLQCVIAFRESLPARPLSQRQRCCRSIGTDGWSIAFSRTRIVNPIGFGFSPSFGFVSGDVFSRICAGHCFVSGWRWTCTGHREEHQRPRLESGVDVNVLHGVVVDIASGTTAVARLSTSAEADRISSATSMNGDAQLFHAWRSHDCRAAHWRRQSRTRPTQVARRGRFEPVIWLCAGVCTILITAGQQRGSTSSRWRSCTRSLYNDVTIIIVVVMELSYGILSIPHNTRLALRGGGGQLSLIPPPKRKLKRFCQCYWQVVAWVRFPYAIAGSRWRHTNRCRRAFRANVMFIFATRLPSYSMNDVAYCRSIDPGKLKCRK